MRSTLALLLCLSLVAAQQPPPAEEVPLFRTTTRLVEFSFIALDKKGNPVTDLKKEEIAVTDSGKPRDIAFFRFEGAVDHKDKPQSLPAGLFTNRAEYSPGPPRNITALVIDRLNTPPQDQMWVRATVARYLKALPPSTRIGIYVLGTSLGIAHDFTDDADALRARVDKIMVALAPQATTDLNQTIRDAEQFLAMMDNDPRIAEMLEQQIEVEQMFNQQVRERRLNITLDSLEALGNHLAGIPGRKNLVWVSGGVSMLSITGAMGFGPRGGIKDYEEQIQATSRRLAHKGVALYFVDSRGLYNNSVGSDASIAGTPSLPGRGRFARQQQAETTSGDPLPAAFSMTGTTGGRVIMNTNDLAEGMKAAANDVRGAYSAGFYTTEEPDSKWHGLKLRTSRDGVRLLVRQGYLAEAPAPAPTNWTQEQWRTAVHNPLGSTGIHIDVRCEPSQGGEAGALDLAVQVDPMDLNFQNKDGDAVAEVEIAIADKTNAGGFRIERVSGALKVPISQKTPISSEQCVYQRAWKPGPDTATIRIVVRDKRTNRFGTLDLPLRKIPAQPQPGAR
jgi:VWFA-related protein